MPLARAFLDTAAEPRAEPEEQEEVEEGQISIRSKNTFQPLFRDNIPPFDSVIASTRNASLLVLKLPQDKGLGSSYPQPRQSFQPKPSLLDEESNIKQSTRRKGKGRALPIIGELMADALIAAQGRLGHDQPLVRQNKAEEPYLVSEEEDKQEGDPIRLFIYALHTLPAIDNDYSSNEEPLIHRLDSDDDLDINLINADNGDIKPRQEGVKEPAKEDLLAAWLEAHCKTGIDIIQEFTQQLVSFHGCSHKEYKSQVQLPHI